jgi:sugar (pentulose or hexulose) kinase
VTAEAVLVMDVGKTRSKLTLMDRRGAVLGARSRDNDTPVADGRRVLDVDGIWSWMTGAAGELARLAHIAAIVPVGHGAAAALIEGGRLAAPVLDYEVEPPAPIVAAYAPLRGSFADTCSPKLPLGLNLGLQLFWQEQLYPHLWPRRAQAALWPQFWAWKLCGELACEVTSLGCHTDLWRPYAHDFSDLARGRGWAQRLGPLTPSGAVLGPVRGDFAEQTGLPPDCAVLCGVHDSNASLHAVRGFDELAGGAFSLVSTGTWFVAFQAGGEPARLDAARDTLANVDVAGVPVPSARFMGGREFAAIVGGDFAAAGSLGEAEALVRRGVTTTPSFASGGPFPSAHGRIIGEVGSAGEHAALASLHLALMTHASLDLIGSSGPIVIEGRFADDAVLGQVLAALRPSQPVFACPSGDGVALGAARLWAPELRPRQSLRRMTAAGFDLAGYAARWRDGAEGG